jgi:hypothetical protein
LGALGELDGAVVVADRERQRTRLARLQEVMLSTLASASERLERLPGATRANATRASQLRAVAARCGMWGSSRWSGRARMRLSMHGGRRRGCDRWSTRRTH